MRQFWLIKFVSNFYRIEMQKSQLFQAFMSKKQQISKMISESKALPSKQRFTHFEAISQPVYIKAQSNAMYLTHLNTQFKDHLRQFVHEQQSFKQTMFQLAKVTETLEGQKQTLQRQCRDVRTQLNEAELQKSVLSDKADFHLNKILSLQEENKCLTQRGQEYEKQAVNIQEEIQYENCVMSQLKKKNTEIVQKLSLKSIQIEEKTSQMQQQQKRMRQTKSSIKQLNNSIESIYFTLEAQDSTLANLCSSIEQSLEKQNNHITDIEYQKNRLQYFMKQSQKRRKDIEKAEETQDRLMDCLEDLQFQVKRTEKELEIEEKGVDEEVWKIQQEKRRLQENQAMLLELQKYLSSLVEKNYMLQHTLQSQIIQDHTIKKIVDSKFMQPVGKKTKQFLQQHQSQQHPTHSKQKQMKSTASSFKQNSRPFYQNQQIELNQIKNASLYKSQAKSQIQRKKPQQMEFMFQQINNGSRYQYQFDYTEEDRQYEQIV